jgi:hypothetical protein
MIPMIPRSFSIQRTYQLPMAWVKYRILLLWRLPVQLRLHVAHVCCFDVVMHLNEESCYGGCKPPLATELEPAEVTTPVRCAEDSVWIAAKLLVWNSFICRDLDRWG